MIQENNFLFYPFIICTVFWVFLISVTGFIKPLQPSNELHHASIAWEMFYHHRFLVPVQTGLPYAEKTPFLYWLIQLGWVIFGVNTFWLKILPQLFMLGTVLMTYALARVMWPQRKNLAYFAPLLILGVFVWVLENYITWFDMMITFFITTSLYFLYVAGKTTLKRHWFYWGLITGLGVLAKGPVIFLFVLPPAILVCFWKQSTQNLQRTYLCIFLALIFSILIFACWALPAAISGGAQYAHDLFLKQSVSRITGHHGVNRNGYFYLMSLPLLLSPWIIWLRPWRALIAYWRQQKKLSDIGNVIFLLSSLLPAFFILSIFGSKSFSYIFPLIPIFSLLISFMLDQPLESKAWDNVLLIIFYLALGLLYFIGPYFLTPAIKSQYFWTNAVSPWWGIIFLAVSFYFLLLKRVNTEKTVLAITVSSIICCLVLQISIFRVVAHHNDWRKLSMRIAALQEKNIPVAFPNNDHAPEELFEFFGRLKTPIVVPYSKIQDWMQTHPEGWLVLKNYKVSPAEYTLCPVAMAAKNIDNKNIRKSFAYCDRM